MQFISAKIIADLIRGEDGSGMNGMKTVLLENSL